MNITNRKLFMSPLSSIVRFIALSLHFLKFKWRDGERPTRCWFLKWGNHSETPTAYKFPNTLEP